MNLLELKVPNIQHIQKELEAKVSQAPAFFQHSLLVLGFEQLSKSDQKKIDLKQICEICRNLDLIPSATRGGSAEIQQLSKELGLAVLPKGRTKAETKPLQEGSIQEPTTKNSELREPETQESSGEKQPSVPSQNGPIATKIITSPIRSGQQIYAPDCDLIILSSVSAGAEVLSDGNIHIYGTLRGRALAGIKGDTKARIFCSSQEAELVSVAGQFIVDEKLKSEHWKQTVQIHLVDDKIKISTLS